MKAKGTSSQKMISTNHGDLWLRQQVKVGRGGGDGVWMAWVQNTRDLAQGEEIT